MAEGFESAQAYWLAEESELAQAYWLGAETKSVKPVPVSGWVRKSESQ